MTVKELKKMLATLDNNAEVTLSADDNYVSLEVYSDGEFIVLAEEER